MFSKEKSSQIRQEFWITFGRYMAPIPSAEGEKANWINYKTGFRDIYFKMKTERRSASIGIYLTHTDLDVQELFYEQFRELERVFKEIVQEDWNWQLHIPDESGKIISRIYNELEGVSIFNKDDWPALISFFKSGIIAMDEYWSVAKYRFDALKE